MMNEVANFVVNAAWQGSLIALLALAFNRWLRGASGRFRHALLTIALLLSLFVPIVSTLDFPRRIPIGVTAASSPNGQPADVAEIAIISSRSRTLPNVIAVAYFAFVLMAAGRLGRALRFAHRLRRSATARQGSIAFSGDVDAPATVGIVRPLILLPAKRAIPAEALSSAVAHELAHVRRRDPLLQLVIEIAAVFVGFNPLVRLLKSRITTAREIACDEIVVAQTADPLRYARALLAVAGNATAPRCALAFGDNEDLSERLRCLKMIAAGQRASSGRRFFASLMIVIAPLALVSCRLQMFGQSADLSGRWVLNRQETNFGRIPPYQTFSMSIEQQRRMIKTLQIRERKGAVENMVWNINADGVRRPVCVNGVRGEIAGRWSGGRLILDLALANGHVERNTASLTDNGKKLVCEGVVHERNTDGTSFRIVFDRASASTPAPRRDVMTIRMRRAEG